MIKLLELGEHYISDFLKPEDQKELHKYNLSLVLDDGFVHLGEAASPDEMWGQQGYYYRSGINPEMCKQLKNLAEEVHSRVKHQKGDVWLDLATNDGTLFDYVPNTYNKVGIDPADDTFVVESSKRATIVQDYFSYEAYQKSGFGEIKPKVITTIAMFYDLVDPNPFVQDIGRILHNDGLWVVQVSYTPLMLAQLDIGNVCMEHYRYLDLSSIERIINPHGMEIRDCGITDSNGGSVRIYIQKMGAVYATQQIRDCAAVRLESLKQWEQKPENDITNPKNWKIFQEKINSLKQNLVSFLKIEKSKGKKIVGLGASTKGNTLLQYCGLDSTLIDCISERSPVKWGRRTVGTNIPIVSEEEARSRKPDYMLVLPWHFVSEITQRENEYLSNGGKLIIPCPKFTIISK